jgi:hypothetical protein
MRRGFDAAGQLNSMLCRFAGFINVDAVVQYSGLSLPSES